MRRAFVLLSVAMVALIAWSWRPPTPVGGRPTTFLVPLSDSVEARRMTNLLFRNLGAPMDTVQVDDIGALRLVLQPGSYISRTRFDGPRCVHSIFPDIAMRNLAVNAYRIYGKSRGVKSVSVSVPNDSATWGEWFHRSMCSGGRGTTTLTQHQLDSLAAVIPLAD